MKVIKKLQPHICIILISLMSICFLFCIGCNLDEKTKSEKQLSTYFYGVNCYIDKKTGVNYLIKNNGGITPRLDKNGKVIVSKVK